MTLIMRVARLFKADVNAILDNIEEPQLMLKQSLREMEEEVTALQRGLRASQHECEALEVRYVDLEKALHECNEELDVCLTADNQALARSVIRRQLELQQLLQHCQQQQRANQQKTKELQSHFAEQQRCLNAMRQKAELLLDTQGDESDSARPATVRFTVSDDEVEVALLKALRNREVS